MNIEFLDLNNALRDASEWPKCPKCGIKKILIGGHLAACVDCSFIGNFSLIEPTDITRLVRAKLANRPSGERAVILLHHGKASQESQSLIIERASQIGQRIVHYPHLSRAAALIRDGGSVKSFAVIDHHAEMDSILLSLDFPDQAEAETTLREKALRPDMVSRIFEGDASLRPARNGKVSTVVMETHVYNAPSFVQAIAFKRKEPNSFQPVPLADAAKHRIPSWIWQPIDWSVIEIRENIQPVWVAALEIEHDINITYCVCEDLEGAPIVQASFRTPWSSAKPKVKKFHPATAEEGVAKLKKHFEKSVASSQEKDVGRLVFQQEFAWDLAASPTQILSELRTAQLWETYRPIRNSK